MLPVKEQHLLLRFNSVFVQAHLSSIFYHLEAPEVDGAFAT